MMIYNIEETSAQKPINLTLPQVVGAVKITPKLTRIAVMPLEGFVVDRSEFVGHHVARGGDAIDVGVYPECTSVIFTEDNVEENLRISLYVGDLENAEDKESFKWEIISSPAEGMYYLSERKLELSTRNTSLLISVFDNMRHKITLSSTYAELTKYYLSGGIILSCHVNIGNGTIGQGTACLLVNGEESVEVFLTPNRPSIQTFSTVCIEENKLYLNFMGPCAKFVAEEVVTMITKKFDAESNLYVREPYNHLQLGWAWKSNEEMLLKGEFTTIDGELFGSVVTLTDDLAILGVCAYYYCKGARYVIMGTRVFGVEDIDLFMDKLEEGDVSVMKMLDTYIDSTCAFYPRPHNPRGIIRATLESQRASLEKTWRDTEEGQDGEGD